MTAHYFITLGAVIIAYIVGGIIGMQKGYSDGFEDGAHSILSGVLGALKQLYGMDFNISVEIEKEDA